MNKVKWIGSVFGLVCLFSLWGYRYSVANQSKMSIPTEIFAMHVPVPVGNNYFMSVSENPNGYTICANSVQVLSVADFLRENHKTKNDLPAEMLVDESELVYVVHAEFSNVDNIDGIMFFTNYIVYDKSLRMCLNEHFTALLEPELENMRTFSIARGKTKELRLVFTADKLDRIMDKNKVDKMMWNDTFYLCFSEFPVRQVIELQRDSAVY